MGPVWRGLIGLGQMAQDWSLIKLPSECFSLLGWGWEEGSGDGQFKEDRKEEVCGKGSL